MKTLCLRADADSRIGTGHLMRCLALAQAWRGSGGRVQFVTNATAPALLSRLEQEGGAVHFLESSRASIPDASETAIVARRIGADWLVLDGYDFDSEYVESIQGAGIKVLAVDDLGRGELAAADLILNQNVYASAELYPNHLNLLLGLKFALLRREFTSMSLNPRGCVDFSSRVLVTLGGSDFHNITRAVLDLLSAYDECKLEITVLVGPENPHLGSLLFRGSSKHEISVLVNPPNIPEIMAGADVVVSAAGSSCWELAFLGVPMVLVVTAENQRLVARGLEEKGVALVLGDYTDFPKSDSLRKLTSLFANKPNRLSMSERGKGLVDGRGALRVCGVLAGSELQLRPAQRGDAETLWIWLNEPVVRAASFDQRVVSWERHQKWFDEKLSDPDCAIFLGTDSFGNPVGQIRFEVKAGVALADVSIAAEMRGLGYATKLIRAGANRCFEHHTAEVICAFIKIENTASQKSFERAGFDFAGRVPSRENAVQYLMKKP